MSLARRLQVQSDVARLHIGREPGRFASCDHYEQVGQDERARVGEVRADRLVQVGEFTLIGQAKLQDHGVQAAHQVGQDHAPGVTGRVGRGVHQDADFRQAGLTVKLGEAAAGMEVRA